GGLERLGISVDPDANAAVGDSARAVHADSVRGWVISPDGSPVTVLVVPTDEEWEIARQSLAVVRASR
ncbi:MAG: hypothetical protein ACTHOK_08075, partial [Nocardioidaceae bacterium]